MAYRKAEEHSTPSQAQPASCHLLSLPAELRDYICELAFTTTAGFGDPINIVDARGPSRSLAQTCQQFRAEASGIHQRAWDDYWATGHFELRVHVLTEESDLAAFQRLEASAVASIRHLTLYVRPTDRPLTRKCIYMAKGWEAWSHWPASSPGSRQYVRFGIRVNHCSADDPYVYQYETVEQMEAAEIGRPPQLFRDQFLFVVNCLSRRSRG